MIFITTDVALVDAVQSELKAQVSVLSRADTALAALRNSHIVIARDLATAVEISNRYAPEHLIIQTEEPRALLPGIRNAGSVFLGPWAPESIGDYCSGTNHVLPTYGYASTFSGLGVEQFMRSMTVQEASLDGLKALAPSACCLADMEGLDAHAAAIERRLSAGR